MNTNSTELLRAHLDTLRVERLVLAARTRVSSTCLFAIIRSAAR